MPMPAAGLAVLLATSWSACGLRFRDSGPDKSIPPKHWRAELKRLARNVRAACNTGNFSACQDSAQRLQDHVWDQLRGDAIKLGVSEPWKPEVTPRGGNGLHVTLPACNEEDPPEFFYRHVPKAAGFNILMNLHRFAGHEASHSRNFEDRTGYDYFKTKVELRPNSTFTFTFARNPITRFVSGYSQLEWEAHRDAGAAAPALARGTRQRAAEFIRGLLRRGFYNYHIAPQVQFYMWHYRGGGQPFDFIGRVEDFAPGWRRLEEMANCSGKIAPWNYTIGYHPSSADPFGTTKAMRGLVDDTVHDANQAAWFDLGVDLNGTAGNTTAGAPKLHADGLAMKDLLLAPDGVALRVVCYLLLPDFYLLSYALPKGCKHLNVDGLD